MTFSSVTLAHKHPRGFTLIEIILVVAVLLGLISITFVGANSYREGANRALCIQNAFNVQTAMRSHCNFRELSPGEAISTLKQQIFVDAQFFEEEPSCPSGGTYAFHADSVPPIGTVFMQCSAEEHLPEDSTGW